MKRQSWWVEYIYTTSVESLLLREAKPCDGRISEAIWEVGMFSHAWQMTIKPSGCKMKHFELITERTTSETPCDYFFKGLIFPHSKRFGQWFGEKISSDLWQLLDILGPYALFFYQTCLETLDHKNYIYPTNQALSIYWLSITCNHQKKFKSMPAYQFSSFMWFSLSVAIYRHKSAFVWYILLSTYIAERY